MTLEDITTPTPDEEITVQEKITYPESISLPSTPSQDMLEKAIKCRVYSIKNTKTHHVLSPFGKNKKRKLKKGHRYMMTTSVGWFILEYPKDSESVAFIRKSCRWNAVKRVKITEKRSI